MTDLPAPRPATPAALRRFGANTSLLLARLRRRRGASSPRDRDRFVRVIGAGALLTALLIVVAMISLDAGSVGWARSLGRDWRVFFGDLTRYGKSDWLLIPTGVFGLILLFGAWQRVERHIAAAWTEVGAMLFFFFVSVAGSGLTNNLVKWLVGRSRPWRFDTDGPFTFTPFAFDSVHYSFPSGHATTVTAAVLACIFMMRRWRWVAGLLLLFLLAIGLSRIVVSAHYPSDVIGGIFIGAAFTYAFALSLGRTGVAFQRQPGGWLLPKTIAIRRAFRRKPRLGALAVGLISAYAPVRPVDPSRPPA